jgi:hypothetical protein
MAETSVPPVRRGLRTLAFVVPVVLAVVVLAASCAETRRSQGEACLKSEDCLSGICSQLVCVAAPPTIDAAVENDAAATGPETGPAAETGPGDAAVDVVEAGPETGPEASGPDSSPDAPGD